MQLIKEITDADIGLVLPLQQIPYYVRKAARVILLNEKNEVALLHVAKDSYHKLPGGGLEGQEEIIPALKREVLEEAGAEIADVRELGLIIEHRTCHQLLQISYCYTARVAGELRTPDYTAEELANGFQLKWVPLADAIELLEQDKPARDAAKFIRVRDLAFLQHAARN